MNAAVDITLKAAVTLALVLLLALGVPCLATDTNGDGTRGLESSASDSLQRLEQRLQLFEEMLLQQRTEMDRLTETLTHQQSTMAHQEEMLTHQQLTMARQGKTMRQLLQDRLDDRSELQVLRGKVSSLKLNSAQDTDTDPRSPEAKRRVSDASANHNRSSRSDDLDPLQATVLRLDQTVTQLTAQTQALSSKSDVMDQMVTQLTAQTQALSSKSDVMDHTVTQLTAQTQALSSKSDAASASSFVRWGHAHCPDHSDLVYSGVVGGSWYTDPGSATNYLCLTLKPTFTGHSVPVSYAKLFGAEYETYDSHMNQDPVCAVCRARMSATVMIPGTDTCTEGWVRQYSGYLMAGFWNAVAGSEYICVDSSLQSQQGSIRDDNGKLLYYVFSRCGSLPCEPYVNNKVISCVVCSK